MDDDQKCREATAVLEGIGTFRAAADRLADWVDALDLEEDEDGYGPERDVLLVEYLVARGAMGES